MITASSKSAARPVAIAATIALALLIPAVPAEAGRAGIPWIPGNPNHQSSRRGNSIQYVVIHTIEGSFQSGIRTFQGSSRRVSIHYVVGYDGQVAQMVEESVNAWHAGNSTYNRRSIGIEHEGFAGRNNWTDAQYRASAAITRAVCDDYNIPKDRQHIIGHKEVPGATHWDPGPHFDWDYYMWLVRGGAGNLPTVGRNTGNNSVGGNVGNGGGNGRADPRPSVQRPQQPRDLGGPIVRPARPRGGEVIGFTDLLRPERVGDGGVRGVTLRWRNDGTPHIAYRVMLDDDRDSRNGVVFDSGHVDSARSAARIPAALFPGKDYFWIVRVVDARGRVRDTDWAHFKTDFTPPVVHAMSPTHGEEVKNSPTLRWWVEDGDGDPVSFRVQLDDDADHSTIKSDTKELNGNPGSWSLRSRLEPDRTYYWRVGVYDGRGNTAVCPWQSFRTGPDYQNLDGITAIPISPRAGQLASPSPVFHFQFYNREGNPQIGAKILIDDDDSHDEVLLDLPFSGALTAVALKRELPPGAYSWKVVVTDGFEVGESAWTAFRVPTPAELRQRLGGFTDRIQDDGERR